ncbi:MAG: ABC transporter permease, partial [Candidatus Aminicenantes bacterium]|nr:ABC transporter permease [Candidatus Aminicenantes bacterium]
MKWKNLIKVAFKSILKNRMRSLLTMLGIIIGVGAVIALVAIGQGASADIEGQISDLGTNLLIIMPGSTGTGGVSHGAASLNTLTMGDVKKLKEEATLMQNVSPVINAPGQVIAAGRNWATSVQGVSPNYLEIRDWSLEKGSFFTQRDVRSRKKVAVLGKSVVDELFGEQDPLGAKIRIRNIPFTIIGVLTEKGQSMMGDQDDVILAPAATVLYRMSDGRTVNTIMASATSVDEMDATIKEASKLLRQEHRLRPGDNDDFMIRSQTEFIQAITGITTMLTMLLGAIAGVSLLVGGIGIMNIMLVSVTERTKEIGIRLSIGARAGDILVQFLIEAVILSMLGGMIGILMGIGLGKMVSGLINSSLIIDPFIT